MNWYLKVLKKYAVFDGRARRKEYWYFVLFNMLIACVLVLAGSAYPQAVNHYEPLILIYVLAVLTPGLAVSVRRLHDTGRSGWWLFFKLIPIAGIVVFIFLASDGQPGENQYGADPKSS